MQSNFSYAGVLHGMGGHDLPDVSALALQLMHTYQASCSCPCCIYGLEHRHPWSTWYVHPWAYSSQASGCTSGPGCTSGLRVHISGRPLMPMLQILKVCNNFAPKIKGIQRVAYLMSPWFGGNIFDVTLALWRLCWRLYIYNKGWRFQSWVLLITAIETINTNI